MMTGRQANMLSADDALRIANGIAAENLLSAFPLVLRDIENEDGHVIWRFWTATKGSSLTVDVNDTTGLATIDRWGIR